MCGILPCGILVCGRNFGVRKFGVCNFAEWFLAYGILLCLDNHQSLDNHRMTFIRICNHAVRVCAVFSDPVRRIYFFKTFFCIIISL